MVRDKTTLKNYFLRGKKPTEEQFGDLIDTMIPYTKWVGFISQSGTSDPVITEIENTIGVAPTVSRLAPGIYGLEFLNKIPDADKCIIFQNTNGAVTTDISGNMTVSKTIIVSIVDNIFIYSFYEGQPPTDSCLQNGFNLEIRVYP